MKTFSSKTSARPALFKGFRYILTYFGGCLYHIILLPQADAQPNLPHIETARYQVQANRLPTWLVTSEHEALFVDSATDLSAVVPVPRPRSLLFGKLLSHAVIPETREILDRYLTLSLHAAYLHGDVPALLVGDPTKGGRPASPVEIARLSGRQPNGIPNGLRQCATCLEWCGACLDPTVPRLLVNVHCRCQNQNRCARCGQLLYGLKLNSNHFSESDASIWHVPGFCATKHGCPLAVESWATQRFISPKTARYVQ
jgi:hypothetical protein